MSAAGEGVCMIILTILLKERIFKYAVIDVQRFVYDPILVVLFFRFLSSSSSASISFIRPSAFGNSFLFAPR